MVCVAVPTELDPGAGGLDSSVKEDSYLVAPGAQDDVVGFVWFYCQSLGGFGEGH